MNNELLARLAEIDAKRPITMTEEDAASLAAADAMDDGSAENINETIKRHSKTTKAQQKAVRRYVKKSYDRLDLVLPKGQKAEIKQAAAARGESVNGFLTRIIADALAQSQTRTLQN